MAIPENLWTVRAQVLNPRKHTSSGADMQQTDFVATLFDGDSNPDKVTVTFTMAVNAVLKGHTATIILMAQAVGLGKPGAAAGMAIGHPFEPVADLLSKFIDGGGRIAICRSCMIHNGLSEEQMDSRFGIIGAPDVVDLLMGAKGTLQVT
jgi:predicted peroxiredoxin